VQVLVELHSRHAPPWIPPHLLAIINSSEMPIDALDTIKVSSFEFNIMLAISRDPLSMQTLDDALQLLMQKLALKLYDALHKELLNFTSYCILFE
jgi:hypothetical protein